MNARYIYRQERDYYVFEYKHIESKIGQLGDRVRYTQLQQQILGGRGGRTFPQRIQAQLREFQDLFFRRDIVLEEIHRLEKKLGLNVYTDIH